MILTPLAFGSRMVVTVDVTETDLPQPQEWGLIAAQKILKSVEGIAFFYLSRADVVRHPLVQKTVSA
jgi:phosphate starvation-inducible PhoH-like protein